MHHRHSSMRRRHSSMRRHRRWKKLPYFWLIERRFLAGAQALFVTSAMEAEHLQLVIHHPHVEVLAIGCRDPRGLPEDACGIEMADATIAAKAAGGDCETLGRGRRAGPVTKLWRK